VVIFTWNDNLHFCYFLRPLLGRIYGCSFRFEKSLYTIDLLPESLIFVPFWEILEKVTGHIKHSNATTGDTLFHHNISLWRPRGDNTVQYISKFRDTAAIKTNSQIIKTNLFKLIFKIKYFI
jgi:hypothetical protein